MLRLLLRQRQLQRFRQLRNRLRMRFRQQNRQPRNRQQTRLASLQPKTPVRRPRMAVESELYSHGT